MNIPITSPTCCFHGRFIHRFFALMSHKPQAKISETSPDLITASGCYPNRLQHQPHCMLAVALSLFGEGFTGPDGSGPAQHKSMGLTSGGGTTTHQLWRNGTDKGRDPTPSSASDHTRRWCPFRSQHRRREQWRLHGVAFNARRI